MNDQTLEDILTAHADALRHGHVAEGQPYLAAFLGQRSELDTLMTLAENLARALVPVKPAKNFRDGLAANLQLAAHHQAAQLALNPNRVALRYPLWLGAAALGASVAAGGIIAWVARRNSRLSHSHAGSV